MPSHADSSVLASAGPADSARPARPWMADALLLAVAAAWGSTYLVAKGLVSDETVLSMLAVRMSATAVVLGALLLLLRKRPTRAALRTGGPGPT